MSCQHFQDAGGGTRQIFKHLNLGFDARRIAQVRARPLHVGVQPHQLSLQSFSWGLQLLPHASETIGIETTRSGPKLKLDIELLDPSPYLLRVTGRAEAQ